MSRDGEKGGGESSWILREGGGERCKGNGKSFFSFFLPPLLSLIFPPRLSMVNYIFKSLLLSHYLLAILSNQPFAGQERGLYFVFGFDLGLVYTL